MTRLNIPKKPNKKFFQTIKLSDFKVKLTHEQLQNNIVGYAKERGYRVQYWWKSVHSPAGFPDLVLSRILPDSKRLIFAELKSEKDKPTEAQKEWLDILKQYPQNEVYLWYPKDWFSGSIEKILE